MKLLNFRVDNELKNKIDSLKKWKKYDITVSDLMRNLLNSSIRQEYISSVETEPNILAISRKFENNVKLTLNEICFLFVRAHQAYLHAPHRALNRTYLQDCIGAFESVILIVGNPPDAEYYANKISLSSDHSKTLTLLEETKQTMDYVSDKSNNIDRSLAEMITRPLSAITSKEYFKNIDIIKLNKSIKNRAKSLITLAKYNISTNEETGMVSSSDRKKLAHFSDLNQLYKKILLPDDILETGIKYHLYKGDYFRLHIRFELSPTGLMTFLDDAGNERVSIDITGDVFFRFVKAALGETSQSSDMAFIKINDSCYAFKDGRHRDYLDAKCVEEVREAMRKIYSEREMYFSEINFQYGDI